MKIEHKKYNLAIDDHNGSLQSFGNERRSFIHTGSSARALFTLRLRDEQGKRLDLSALDARRFSLQSSDGEEAAEIRMDYADIGGLSMQVHVEVTCPHDTSLTYWNLSVDHDTDYIIEWIDFPAVIVPNDLISTGGKSRVVWPAMEGVLIEDVEMRESSWLKYQEVGYPSKGWEGIYPGPCPTQFMAYYDDQGGIYLGAHDAESHVKSIEFCKYDDGIKLEFKLFPGAIGRGSFRMNYSMVLGVFAGDWHDAADIYRSWYLKSTARKPLKLCENERLPDWIKESPVVVTYPVRGVKDTGNMDPNEYFPYTNAIPHLSKLANDFDSKVMALLMHWEGTAPWAPPYVWPPFGGEENFNQFADQLHELGHLLGVYCSGTAWTSESLLVPEYNRKVQFEEQKLAEIMCTSAEGELPYSLICNGAQRWGYDMCPTNDFVTQVVTQEVSHILKSGCDYIQFFDQNLGGLSYFCYSKNHDHPPAPGKWQKEAMLELFRKLQELVDQSGKKVIIGCEAAAAEPFIENLLFNDMRFNITLFFGNPIPLYQYIYHEYINNFMGNQNTSGQSIDLQKSPDNLLWRTAFSFNAGDMLTVVLKDHGEINWDWGTEWTTPKPDQDHIIQFIRNINAWRTGAAKPYLCFGRMFKPYEIKCKAPRYTYLRNGSKLTNPPLLSSRWESPAGEQAQVIVNYTTEVQEFTVLLDDMSGTTIKIIGTADGKRVTDHTMGANSELFLHMEPLSAMMIKMEDN